MKKFIINKKEFQNIRIDKWLKINFSSLNQSFIEKNLRKENIKVNNKKVPSKYKLEIKDIVKIFNYSPEKYKNHLNNLKKSKIPSNYLRLFKSSIIFENKNFIVLEKWTGIATQGGSKINISIDHIIKNISLKYNLVHRLDRETSGLLIIAKNIQSTKYFGKLFKDRLVNKIYVAICNDKPKKLESEVKLSMVNKKNKNTKDDSVTFYKVLENKNRFSTIFFSPITGKTHQIRIVSKYLGCPIVGDSKYNKYKKYNLEKLKLNAHYISFVYDNNKYEFLSKLPNHFNEFLKKNNLKKIDSKELDFFSKVF